MSGPHHGSSKLLPIKITSPNGNGGLGTKVEIDGHEVTHVRELRVRISATEPTVVGLDLIGVDLTLEGEIDASAQPQWYQDYLLGRIAREAAQVEAGRKP